MNRRIKEVRQAAGLTMAAFGASIGVSPSAINHIEHGTNNPAERTLAAICTVYGVRREWLDTGAGPMYISNIKTAQAIEWATETLSGGDTFKRRLLEVLARLDPAEWDLIEKLIDDLSEKENPAADDSATGQ